MKEDILAYLMVAIVTPFALWYYYEGMIFNDMTSLGISVGLVILMGVSGTMLLKRIKEKEKAGFC